MTAVFFIASYDVVDPARYENDYVPHVQTTLASAGAEVVVATGSAERLEGDAAGQHVVFRFPSQEAFDDWYRADGDGQLRQLRARTTTNTSAVLARGFVEHRSAL